MMVKFIFWLSLIMIFYTYIGYPLLITIIAALKKKRKAYQISRYPEVSVIIPVQNGEEYSGYLKAKD